MLNDFTGADRVYIACGYTDLRKGIDGLAAMVQQEFEMVRRSVALKSGYTRLIELSRSFVCRIIPVLVAILVL